jgi:hypothetical protein
LPVPDAKITATFSPGETLKYSTSFAGKNILLVVEVGLLPNSIKQSSSDTILTKYILAANAALCAEVPLALTFS